MARQLTEGEKRMVERFDAGLRFIWGKEHQEEREAAVGVLRSMLAETDSFGWRVIAALENRREHGNQ